jgi:hypothetical protein
VASTRQWHVVITIQSDSGMEVAICADSQWLVPSFFSHTPIAALDFVKGGLVDARRGDDIFVELRSPGGSQASFAAPTADGAMNWLAARLIEEWHTVRSSSGTYRPPPLKLDDDAESADEPKRDAG